MSNYIKCLGKANLDEGELAILDTHVQAFRAENKSKKVAEKLAVTARLAEIEQDLQDVQSAIDKAPKKVAKEEVKIADIKAEISEISAKAKRLMDEAVAKDPLGSINAHMFEADFLTPEERERLHQLKLQLPSQGEEVDAAKQRIKERIAKRKTKKTAKQQFEEKKTARQEAKERAAEKIAKRESKKEVKKKPTRYSAGKTTKPFYSALTRAVEGIKMNTAPVNQWKAMIAKLNQKGVKQGEIDQSDLVAWLDKQQGKINRDQVIEYLRSDEAQARGVEAPLFATSQFTKDFTKQREAVVTQIKKLVNTMAPMADVEVVDRLFGEGPGLKLSGATGTEVAGAYHPATSLIQISLTKGDVTNNVQHEAVHALRAAGLFRDSEWDLLSDQAEKQWKSDYGVTDTEEAVAYAFGDWRAKKITVTDNIAKLFRRLKLFMTRLGNMLRGRGFNTIEDVFEKVAKGEVGQRQAEQRKTVVKFSADKRKTGNKNLDSLLSKIGGRKTPLKQRIDDMRLDLKETINQGMFDRFYGIKRAQESVDGAPVPEEDAYIAARFTTSLSAQVLQILRSGPLKWKNGMAQIDKSNKGLLEIMQPVADKIDLWSAYMVARRSKRLMAEGREKLLTEEEIESGLALAKKHPEFEKVAEDWASFNTSILNFAEEAGLINPETRPLWDHSDYIPFFRLVEGDFVKGPHGKRGFSGQQSGIKKLKGGTSQINDILENMIQNTVHLVDASMKNHALDLAINHLDGSEFVTKAHLEVKPEMIPANQIKNVLQDYGVDTNQVSSGVFKGLRKMLSIKAPIGRNVVKVMREGKSEYYYVHDELLLRSLTSINDVKWGSWMKIFSAPKRWLTVLVTSDPSFMLRNWVRDTLHAFVISRDRMTPVLSGTKGLVKAMRKSDVLETVEASGAGFHGGYIHAGDPESVAKVIHAELRNKNFKETILDTPRKVWDHWMDVSYAFENANRIAIAEAAKEAGKTDIESAYEFKDLMDFSMHGDWHVVQFLVQTVPFLGARIQGLHRLGRSAHENPKAFAAKGMLLAMASVALYLRYRDDDRYKELEDWDKNTYYHWWIGDQHFRMPKPFEVGAVFGTIPERLTEYILSESTDDEKELLKQLQWVLSETFNMGSVNIFGVPIPLPHTIAPIMEQWANRNSFTERPIVGRALERLLPEAQYTPWTSETAKAFGEATNLSPVRIEHLINGYFGTIGSYVLGASDVVTRRLMDYPNPPAMEFNDLPVVRSFYRGSGPARNTKYSTQMYELLQEVDQTYATILNYRRTGDHEKARDLMKEERDEVRLRPMLHAAQKRARTINKKIRKIHSSTILNPEEKRKRIDRLIERKNREFKRAMERVEKRKKRSASR